MANVQHSTLTDPNLHEPKGIAAAGADQVYRSNGSGSGTWTNANRLPGTGWGKYTNTTYTGTTGLAISTSYVLIPFTTDDTVTQLPINYAGTTTSLMNLSTETFLFDAIGSLYLIDVGFQVYSTSGTPKVIGIRFNTSTDGVTWGTSIAETYVSLDKGAGQLVNQAFVLPVNSNMATYGARMSMETDTGTANIIDISATSARIHRAR